LAQHVDVGEQSNCCVHGVELPLLLVLVLLLVLMPLLLVLVPWEQYTRQEAEQFPGAQAHAATAMRGALPEHSGAPGFPSLAHVAHTGSPSHTESWSTQ
jgi:hypothetical protein